jgi:hypothetical protein
MATVEQRLSDLEYLIGHLPEDLDARFAGVDTKLAAIREVLALHTTRFTTVEHKIGTLDHKIDGLAAEVPRGFAAIENQLAQVLERLPRS